MGQGHTRKTSKIRGPAPPQGPSCGNSTGHNSGFYPGSSPRVATCQESAPFYFRPTAPRRWARDTGVKREEQLRATKSAMFATVAARATLPGALQPGDADRTLVQAPSVAPWYKLHVLTPEQAGDGVCLDGSPPGFFYSPPPLLGGRNDSWLLHLDGGGWCTDLEACKVRSKMFKGTSTGWKWAPDQAGILNTEAARNPTFHGFHKAVLKYCDGASFSGDVQDPVIVGNTSLHFRTPPALN